MALAAVIIATAFAHQARATVTWSFFETGISCTFGSCFLPPQPHVFATLTLPGPTSAGTARWQGFPDAPIYTGGDFSFVSSVIRVSPAFTGTPNCHETAGPPTLCDFDIAWSATASGLAVAINVDAIFDNIGGETHRPFGPFGGGVASDGEGYNGGCVMTVCEITGFWQSDLPVPEPGSLGLVASALSFLLAYRFRSVQPR